VPHELPKCLLKDLLVFFFEITKIKSFLKPRTSILAVGVLARALVSL